MPFTFSCSPPPPSPGSHLISSAHLGSLPSSSSRNQQMSRLSANVNSPSSRERSHREGITGSFESSFASSPLTSNMTQIPLTLECFPHNLMKWSTRGTLACIASIPGWVFEASGPCSRQRWVAKPTVLQSCRGFEHDPSNSLDCYSTGTGCRLSPLTPMPPKMPL